MEKKGVPDIIGIFLLLLMLVKFFLDTPSVDFPVEVSQKIVIHIFAILTCVTSKKIYSCIIFWINNEFY